MKLIWHGKTSFTLQDKKRSIVIDPQPGSSRKGDFVLYSSPNPQSTKVEGAEKTFMIPGEYETKGVPIVGIQANLEEGQEPTNIFYFEMEGIGICHLGSLAQKLTSDMIKRLEAVDILMISVGEGTDLSTKQAMEIVESVDPRIVVLMGEGDFAPFLKEAGAENLEEQASLDIAARSDLPEDSRRYVKLQVV